VAEQLALDQVAGKGAAVDDAERPVTARRVTVDLLGNELLAGAGLAFDEHGGVGGRHRGQHAVELLHRRGAAHQAAEFSPGTDQLGCLLAAVHAQHRVAHADLRALPHQHLSHPGPTVERSVGALEVPHQVPAVPDLELEVVAGDPGIVEGQVVVRRATHPHALVPQGAGRSAVGTGRHADHGGAEHEHRELLALIDDFGGAVRHGLHSIVARRGVEPAGVSKATVLV